MSVVTPADTLEVAIERGYLPVDFSPRGRACRVFNTHLEQRLLAPSQPTSRLLQVGQAVERAGSALGAWHGVKRVPMLGDINADPSCRASNG